MTMSSILPKIPYNRVIEVTPELAAKWLEGNTHNRALRPAAVERYAADMLAGRWGLTHQGIAFDDNGVLLDGQHRLWAIIEANMSIKFRVFFNESPSARWFTDTGNPRKNVDVLALTGESGAVTEPHLATIRFMLAGPSARSVRRSPSEEADQYGRHREAVDFALKYLGRSCRRRGLATAPIRAVIARAYYYADHRKLSHFCDVLRGGIPGSETDHIVIALREFLTRSHNPGGGESIERVRYSKTQWALRQFLDGRLPKKLLGTDVDLFPLPMATNQAKTA